MGTDKIMPDLHLVQTFYNATSGRNGKFTRNTNDFNIFRTELQIT